ncbi:MAG: cytochrome c biogenesis protein CcsA [Desulfosarcina sp.]|nr:cytochrome c biogenesis protein CcsA [Desulfosarcina sp.]MBC2766816.1 cytochrome c biogenesis protein CcsA [Desulfosarcina sp.]
MSSSPLLSISTFVFALAAFLYMAALIFKKPKLTLPARWTVVAAVVVTTAGILLRWVESYQMGIGHAPLSNLYESLVFFAWTAGVIYLFVEFKYKNPLIGAFVAPIAFLAMAYASMSPNISDRIQPLIPALKSNWLIAHVVTCFFGYAAFAIAFGMSLMYLLKTRNPEKIDGIIGHIPKLDILDELTHRMVLFGWFVYATLLHARLMRGWQGKQIAYLSVLGFAAVLFTYFGVNLLPGLHSYGKV